MPEEEPLDVVCRHEIEGRPSKVATRILQLETLILKQYRETNRWDFVK